MRPDPRHLEAGPTTPGIFAFLYPRPRSGTSPKNAAQPTEPPGGFRTQPEGSPILRSPSVASALDLREGATLRGSFSHYYKEKSPHAFGYFLT